MSDAPVTEPVGSEEKPSPPGWRGWLAAFSCVILLSLFLPKIEFVLRGSRLTMNLMPVSSIFFVFTLILCCNAALWIFRRSLRLTKQDLAFVFCLTMTVNNIPGNGFMTYFVAETAGVHYFAEEHGWKKRVVDNLPRGFTPQDPEDPLSEEPRPVEWLYRGLPVGESIPWRCWIRPYLYWASMGLMLYGLMFALCVLLREQWAEREMLPFPLAEIPREMIAGKNDDAVPGQAFLKDKTMWLGFGAVFLFHSWNMMLNYVPEWPVISISNASFGEDYLTEKPWSALRPMQFIVLPSVIAVTYLVGKEIGFSLWFFYAVLKIGVLIMVGLGYGGSHHDFLHTPDDWRGTFINQGMGALIGWAFVGFWAARGPLKSSLLRAFKKKDGGQTAADDSLRSAWLLLAACFCGSVGWLTWMNVHWSYALVAVCALVLVGVTVARMASEGGIFKPEIKTSPVDMTLLVFPPATVEPASLVPLSMWSRLTMFDQFRISPMVSLITALQVGARTGLRRRSLHLGMCLALVTAFGVSFFSFLGTLYHEPEASGASWIMEKHPMYEFKRIAWHVGLSEARNEKLAEAAEKGWGPDEIPPIHGANRDRMTWTWLGLGAALTTLFFWLRTRLFWWPHPAGYAFWAGQGVYNQLWFSFLLGWLFKVADLRFGGMKAFRNRRRFFIGVIAGEAFSAVFWILINWASDTTGGYKVWIC